MFSCEFSEIFKDTFFTEHLWTTAGFRPEKWTASITLSKFEKQLFQWVHRKVVDVSHKQTSASVEIYSTRQLKVH